MDPAKVSKPTDQDAAPPDPTVLHLAYPLWRKHLLVGVARAKELQEKGHPVTVTYCNADNGTCAANYFGNAMVCRICRSRAKTTAEQAGLQVVPLTVLGSQVQSVTSPDGGAPEDTHPLANVGDSRTKGPQSVSPKESCDLQEGVQSGITSAFRSLPDDTSASQFIQSAKERYLATSQSLLVSMKQVLTEIRPQRVEVFSGRHACSRFALTAAKSLSIPFNTLEITATKRPIIFRGHTPHDRKKIQERIRSHAVDMELAERFYKGRRQPRGNRHTKRQQQAFTPPSASGFRKKVSVFLSSQDEFEALGRDWESPFDDYVHVLDRLSSQYTDQLFCVRFHPNQGEMTSDVISPFRDIHSRPNVKLYLPDDSINTYGLIEWSDTVITFGSTVTVEACWMHKPVILMGRSFFDGLGVAHVPETVDEACALVGRDLSPSDRTGAAQFASYFLTDGDSLKYISEGKPFVSKGFRDQRPWLGRMARVTDNALCSAVKHWMAFRMQTGRRAA